ncbi:MAG: class I SAM-dependent methyltransferase, partial [Alphaproteobacteria bacterium]
RHRVPPAPVLAPDIFWWRFEQIYRYTNAWQRPSFAYEWAIVHKGRLGDLPAGFVDGLAKTMAPVFANEVFVVWAREGGLPRLPPNARHLAALFDSAAKVTRHAPPPKVTATGVAYNEVSEDDGWIRKFSDLSIGELKTAMERFFTNGGYLYETLRDKRYDADLDKCTRRLLGDSTGQRVLDIGCGAGRLGRLAPDGTDILHVDLSETALRIAAAGANGRPDRRFAQMDAHRLALPGASFDIVAIIDAIEHFHRPEIVLGEAARVIEPGGALLLTAQNRNSLNQIMARKLGYSEYVTNYQHVREFTLDELTAILATHGFDVEQSAGIGFYPYWGIPGIDHLVRHLTDDDSELVEILGTMGEQIGPHHAYTMFLRARKNA